MGCSSCGVPTEPFSRWLRSSKTWHGVVTLRIGFSPAGRVDASRDGDTIEVTVDGTSFRLSRRTATALRSAIGTAVRERRSFLRTEGIHRADGQYEIRRRCADSSGNATVFQSFDTLVAAVDDLPTNIGAADVEPLGVSGSRRHMVVWHLLEHPSFEYELVSRNPLRIRRLE